MSVTKNNASVLPKLFLVLVVVVALGVAMFYRLQRTASVKVVNRDTAVDAVTGSVLVTADGGFKEVKSEVAGKVADASAINKGTRFAALAPLVKLDTKELDREIAETKREYESKQERLRLELENNPEEKVAEEQLATAIRLRDVGTFADEQVKVAQRALDAIRKRFSLLEFDRKKSKADYEATMDKLLLLREKMTIVAPPMDGVVHVPLTWDGALIGASQPVAVVYSNARIVSAKISEESFGKVKLGQKARLRLLTYGSKEFDATVSKLLPTADDAQRFEVWLDVKVEPELLLPNSTGEVTITVENRPNAVVIQRRAIFGGDKVWVVKNGRVERRQVKLGFDSALNVVEVLSGLEVGEQIIVDRLDEYRDGQRVRVEVVS